jgi:hypothetical protein
MSLLTPKTIPVGFALDRKSAQQDVAGAKEQFPPLQQDSSFEEQALATRATLCARAREKDSHRP